MHEGNRFLLNDVKRDAVLLVEGIDDARFFEAFLKRLGKDDAIQIAQVGGKNKFGRFLTGTLKRAENFYRLRRLGLIRDADESAQAAFNSLRGALTDSGLPEPAQDWEIRQEERLHVGVAILPDMDSCPTWILAGIWKHCASARSKGRNYRVLMHIPIVSPARVPPSPTSSWRKREYICTWQPFLFRRKAVAELENPR